MFSREHAPISETALGAIDAQAAATLRLSLSARKFVDVKGPKGWDYAGVPVGRFEKLDKDGAVGYGVRSIIPLVETRVEFELDIFDLHLIDRGSVDPDLIQVEHAAAAAAAFEDNAVYSGFAAAGFKGLSGAAENTAVSISGAEHQEFLGAISDEIYRMKAASSIGGPYALVGGATLRKALGKLVDGRSLLEIVKKNSDVDEFIFTPSSDEAFLVSTRGGDFELTIGGDFVVGYCGCDCKKLRFFLTESFAFRIIEPRAFTKLKLK
jgi:uncharacterized linocin/CFP29 family protein